jgi:hypothetical protein
MTSSGTPGPDSKKGASGQQGSPGTAGAQGSTRQNGPLVGGPEIRERRRRIVFRRAATVAAVAGAVGVTATVMWGVAESLLGPRATASARRGVFSAYRRLGSRLRRK